VVAWRSSLRQRDSIEPTGCPKTHLVGSFCSLAKWPKDMVIYHGYMRDRPNHRAVITHMASRLDGPTLFVNQQARPYIATWHTEAKEICVRRDLGPCDRSSKGEPDPERSAKNSLARAVSRVRVLSKANGLCRLLTLTFRSEVHDRDEVLAAIAVFGRKLSARLPSLRYIYVLEKHPGGHGYMYT
jgi:hypothetical protein